MTLISDELLMAYADGELDHNQRANVEACVRQSPDVAARLEIFKATGRDLAHVFARSLHEPVPQRLIDAIFAPAHGATSMLSQENKAATAAENVIPFVVRETPARVAMRSPVWGQVWGHMGLVAACVTALTVGVSTYWYSSQITGNPKEPSSNLAFALERTASGKKVASLELEKVLNETLGGQTAPAVIGGVRASIKPIFTFATADKTLCRQYEIARENEPSLAGVACREDRGQWRIETQVASDITPVESNNPGIKPAGKDSEAVDVVVDRMISGEAFNNDQEAVVMKRGWINNQP